MKTIEIKNGRNTIELSVLGGGEIILETNTEEHYAHSITLTKDQASNLCAFIHENVLGDYNVVKQAKTLLFELYKVYTEYVYAHWGEYDYDDTDAVLAMSNAVGLIDTDLIEMRHGSYEEFRKHMEYLVDNGFPVHGINYGVKDDEK